MGIPVVMEFAGGLLMHSMSSDVLVLLYVCMVTTYSKDNDQPGKGANLARGYYPCPRFRLGVCFRETGSAVLSRVSLLISILRLNFGGYLRGCFRVPRRCPFIYLNRHTPSGQSRIYRVAQLRTDGVHCRESASTGSVYLKVVPNGCGLGRSSWTN